MSLFYPTILITGGAGFLGKNIVSEFLDDSSTVQPKEIRVYDIKSFEGVPSEKIKFIYGDILDEKSLNDACVGVDLVIHAAAIIDWGIKDDAVVLGTNVGGTANIINACKANHVSYMILTSSLDAVYSGKPLIDIDERQPYPPKAATSYCKSKTLAEALVKNANSEALRTCILRPSGIFGEDDPYHIDPIIDMAMSGLYVRLGNGKSKCQHVYVGNMAYAYVLAAQALFQKNAAIYGQAYFITDSPASNFFSFFDEIVLKAGYKIFPKNLWLPKMVAYPMACMAEFSAWLIRPIKKVKVNFSRFAVQYTCTDFTFNSNKARNDFNFIPKYSHAEAVERTAQFYANAKKVGSGK